MGATIGLLELRSIPIGMKAVDVMLKAADVSLLKAAPACPGKFTIIVEGHVGAVKSALDGGRRVAESYLVCCHTINNVHASVVEVMSSSETKAPIASLGVIETKSALSALVTADIVAKAANVSLLKIKIAHCLGGKGYIVFTGEVSSVQSACDACVTCMEHDGEILSSSVVASPHKDLVATLF